MLTRFRSGGRWLLALVLTAGISAAAADHAGGVFPKPLEDYPASQAASLFQALAGRAHVEPFNVTATLIFLLAIVHTFLTPRFRHLAHEVESEHEAWLEKRREDGDAEDDGQPREVSFKGQMLHFLGEVEAVFGVWAVVLLVALAWSKGWHVAEHYVGTTVNFTEAMFVVVIMALASTRPVLRVAESALRAVASLGRGSVAAWWLSILIIAPLLGSFITEPAAMTIAALLLGRQFYELKPSPRFGYATLGLLFVNISVGGTLTHFAAPPVLMVASPWKWGTAYMLMHFGWKAALGIVLATGLYFAVFRRDFARLQQTADAARSAVASRVTPDRPVPLWISLVQLGFVAWTVLVAHFPALFIGGFLFFLAFSRATEHHQSPLKLRGPLLVGFFLAGLVVHGGLQGWWIEPVLTRLGHTALFAGATALTAFNDNAAITYLATLVPTFTDELKYAVVAGAVTGGGLTVIANAPNPAGQSLLQRYFPQGVSPVGLLMGALPPTIVMAACFLFF